jgi:MAF protein
MLESSFSLRSGDRRIQGYLAGFESSRRGERAQAVRTEERESDFTLASASPRRHELVAVAGWRASSTRVEVEEVAHPGEGPVTFAKRLAIEKAHASAAQAGAKSLVLGADTIVIHEGAILGKPSGEKDAADMLSQLRGKSHKVVTAIALIDQERGRTLVDCCETEVPMRYYGTKEVEAYIHSGDPLDKAGAYAIQNDQFSPVDLQAMRGCYANVMGLPLCHLTRSLRRLGIRARRDVPTRCQEHTGYSCPVYEEILGEEYAA